MLRFKFPRRRDVWFLFSRMDFPSSLRPTLFMTGPLGLSNVPDMSFMCSWRDALTLPESLPENSKVSAAGRALDVAPSWPPLPSTHTRCRAQVGWHWH